MVLTMLLKDLIQDQKMLVLTAIIQRNLLNLKNRE